MTPGAPTPLFFGQPSNITITKAELAFQLSDQLGFNRREAMEMVEAFFEEIADCLAAGHEVKLSGFGKFQLLDKPQRPGRNPKTGETIPVSARRVVTYHPSGTLRDAVDTSPHLVLPKAMAA